MGRAKVADTDEILPEMGPEVETEADEAPAEDSPEQEVEDTDEPADDNPELAEVDLTSGDMGGSGDLFDGIEDAEGRESPSDDADETEPDPLDALDARGESLENAINDGAARLSVVGLDDDEADGLEEEMNEVFSAFRLGYFGAEAFEKYILVSDDDSIDPAWGFAGAAVCSLALVLMLRPDGDEQLARIKKAVSNIDGSQ